MSNEAKTKRKHRTPAEILVEAEQRIERLRLRQAKKEAANDPAIKTLLDEKEDAAKRIREAKKLLGDGPQSATERIKKHEAWIERINAEADEARTILSFATTELDDINARIEQAVSELASKEASA